MVSRTHPSTAPHPQGEDSSSRWRDAAPSQTFDLFESAFEYAAIGMALVGIDYRFLRVNRALCYILGYNDSDLTTITFPAITHPDDLEKDVALAQQLVRNEISAYQMEKRYFHQNGQIIWANLSVSLVRNTQGAPLFFISQIQDITENKRIEHALRLSNARFAKLIENFQGGLLMEDENGRIAMLNQGFCDMFGVLLSPYAMIGQSSRDVPLIKLANPGQFVGRQHYISERRLPITGERIMMRDGRVLERDYTPIVDHETLLGHLWLYRDITDRVHAFARIEQHAQSLQVANSALERMALTDELTGANNRRAFAQRLEEEINKAVRKGTVLSLLITDIDHFKLYNDDFGHPAGDVILRKVAWILQDNTRESDYVARYGGEEFAIILPTADYRTSLEVGERLRMQVADHPWHERAITASFGIATATAFDKEASVTAIGTALIAVADEALYRAKRAGRNCVVHSNDTSPPQ